MFTNLFMKKTERVVLAILLTTFSLGFSGKYYAQENAGELIKRSDIDPKYTWNLTDIYSTQDDFEKDFKWLESKVKEYKKFEGKIGESAESLKKLMKFEEQIGIKYSHLRLYASLSKDLDLADTKNQALFERVSELASKLGTAGAFVRPEMLAIGKEKLMGFLAADDELKVYQKDFDDMFRTQEHTLDKEKEELLALAAPVTRIPYDVFGMFKNADIQYPKVLDESGNNEIQISDGRYYAALYSNDRNYRERVYKGYYTPYMTYKNTYSALFNGNLKTIAFEAKARKYNSTREAALDVNNIPVSVYDNLVNTVNNHTEPLHRWCELKKRLLEVKEMHAYDTYVTLFPSETKEYSYDEGVELVLKSLQPLGEDYIASLNKAFDNRWVDVYETKGKRSGAYSSGTTFGMHPYVLLNWNNQMNDVYTLAHEMGHNMHSYYTGLNQPYPYANYSIFVAEVASTMNEALLLDYLIEHAETKEQKLALIEENLNSITTTFYRQTRFAQFEQMVHEKTAKGESLTPDVLCEMYGELYQKYWGNSMVVDEEETYTWARIPHFYYNFYVYQYATSFAASQALAAKVKKEGKPAIEKFLNFLKAGSSKYPIDVLKEAGVDMTSPETVMAVVNRMNELLDKMEALLDEK